MTTRPAGRVTSAPVTPGPPDLRLVPATLAVWTTVLLGLLLGPWAGAAVTAAGIGVALHAVVQRRGPGGSRRPGAGHPAGRPAGRQGARSAVLLSVAGCVAAAGLVVTAHGTLVAQHPLHAAAERGAAATLQVRLTDDPRPLRSAGYGSRPEAASQVLVEAELLRAEVADTATSGAGRVLLIAPAEGWVPLLPGQTVTAQGVLAPATRNDLTVAVLRVRGAPADVTPPPWWQSAAGALRAGLRDAAAVLPPASAGLLPGLAVGDTGTMLAEVEDDFREAGLAHLTAVSGDNRSQTGV